MKETATTGSRKRNDLLLVIALLVICAIAAVYLFVFRAQGDTVRVMVNNKVYGVYSLSENRTVEIRSEDGAAYNRLVIRDGAAYMESASCPDGICVHHHPIFRDGESIACLPNAVVVTVILENNTDGPDIIV